MAITQKDLIISRKAMEEIEINYQPSLFLTKTFFKFATPSDSEFIDIQVRKGNQSLSPYCSKYLSGALLPSTTRELKTFKPPYQKGKFSINPEDVKKTKVPFYVDNRQTGLIEFYNREITDKLLMYDRRNEEQVAKSLTTGKIIAIGDGIDEEVDFGFDSNQFKTLAGTDVWTDIANSNPLDDIRTWMREITDRGANANILVLGQNSADAFMEHPAVIAKFDNARRYNIGEIATEKIDKFTGKIGYLSEFDLNIFVYSGSYVDENEVRQKYLPEDGALFGSDEEETKGSIEFGAVETFNATNSVKVYVKNWMTEEPTEAYNVELHSPSLAVPRYIDQYIYAKVV